MHTGRTMPMATPKMASNNALPRATQRGQTPRINASPSDSSAAVAAQARNGIVDAGMKDFTFAV